MPAGRNGQYCFPLTFRLLMWSRRSREAAKARGESGVRTLRCRNPDAEPSPGERRQNPRPALARTAPDGYRSVSGI